MSQTHDSKLKTLPGGAGGGIPRRGVWKLLERHGVLRAVDLRWCDEAALSVVMAAKGYPGKYDKGTEIRGLDEAEKVPGVQIFHAGTERRDGRIVATGGRVLNVSALGKDVADARDRAYRAIKLINWPGGFCRSDIGWRALKR